MWWPQCKEIPNYVFPEKELRGLSTNFHINTSVSDFYISTIGPPICIQHNRQTDSWEYIKCSQKHECRNWD
jgi:hypothetical protein